MSRTGPARNPSTSLRRASGSMRRRPLAISSTSASRYRDRRKNQFSSSTRSSGASCSAQRPSGSDVGVVELLAARAVPAGVRAAVEVAGGRAPAPDLLDRGPVPRVGAGAQEVVVRDVERVGQGPEAGRVAGDERRPAPRRRPRAACTFLAACSSVPVRNRTARPRARAWRASTSVCTYSSACPRCGDPLTNGIAVVRYRRSGIGCSSLARCTSGGKAEAGGSRVQRDPDACASEPRSGAHHSHAGSGVHDLHSTGGSDGTPAHSRRARRGRRP